MKGSKSLTARVKRLVSLVFTAALVARSLIALVASLRQARNLDKLATAGGRGGPPLPPEQLPEVESPSRRRFLSIVGLGAAGAGGALVGLPVTGFILSPMLKQEDDVWRDVGPISTFPVGEASKVTFLDPSPAPWSGPAAMSAAWLLRVDETTFIAFKVNCTHLGCAVRWEAGPRFFMCPCHGGVFHEDGSVAAGPPPRPLQRYEVRRQADRVEIRTGPIPITTNFGGGSSS